MSQAVAGRRNDPVVHWYDLVLTFAAMIGLSVMTFGVAWAVWRAVMWVWRWL
jgi:hypothetical protein